MDSPNVRRWICNQQVIPRMPWSGRDRCYLRNTGAATIFSIVEEARLAECSKRAASAEIGSFQQFDKMQTGFIGADTDEPNHREPRGSGSCNFTGSCLRSASDRLPGQILRHRASKPESGHLYKNAVTTMLEIETGPFSSFRAASSKSEQLLRMGTR